MCLYSGSGLVKLSELKGHPLPVKALPFDDAISQRGVAFEEQEEEEEEEEEVAPAVRKRNRKSTATADGGEVKVRGRRQRDFDPTATEDERMEPQERVEPQGTIWTQNQQKLLELALQQFPRGTSERWDRIAKVVPGKTKVFIHDNYLTLQMSVHSTD